MVAGCIDSRPNVHNPSQQDKPKQRCTKKENGSSQNATLAELPQAGINKTSNCGNYVSSRSLAAHFGFPVSVCKQAISNCNSLNGLRSWNFLNYLRGHSKEKWTLCGERHLLVPRHCLGTYCLAGSACRIAKHICFHCIEKRPLIELILCANRRVGKNYPATERLLAR